MGTPHIVPLTFAFQRSRKEQYQFGDLAGEWMQRHPGIFDRDDARLQAGRPDRHFFEWLAAVLFWEATGYYSLIEKYESKAHLEKLHKFETIVGPKVFAEVLRDRTGVPDLLVYASDSSDWFFCEVKGPGDALSQQQCARFKELYAATSKPVYVLYFKERA